MHSGKGRRHVQFRALLLITTLLFPFVQLSIAASQNPENVLPACCLVHGKHKCTLTMQQWGDQSSPKTSLHQVAQIGEKCPCTPALPSTSHSQPLCESAPA